MEAFLALMSLVVDDYDEAIQYFASVLDFRLTEDKDMGEGKRWVVMHPPGSSGCGLLLAKAKNDRQQSAVGNQSGGRVFLFLHTNDFAAVQERLSKYSVKIVRGPVTEAYGRVLVFEDLYGNLWDLIEPAKSGNADDL
ncbi:MAG: VOC family protein [Saprospiraceae bacterium]|nr:VOC family protein [Saprospiraceae bacterium]